MRTSHKPIYKVGGIHKPTTMCVVISPAIAYLPRAFRAAECMLIVFSNIARVNQPKLRYWFLVYCARGDSWSMAAFLLVESYADPAAKNHCEIPTALEMARMRL